MSLKSFLTLNKGKVSKNVGASITEQCLILVNLGKGLFNFVESLPKATHGLKGLFEARLKIFERSILNEEFKVFVSKNSDKVCRQDLS